MSIQMINREWDILILLHLCLSNSPEKFRTIIFLYTLHISLVLILWHLLLLDHYLLKVIYLDIWDLYDVSTDGEHQEKQPGRRGPTTTTSCHYGAADDDVNPVASTNGLEHAEYGAWELECTPSSQRQEERVSKRTSTCLQALHWPTPGWRLATCNLEATWDCTVWWQREGFVCFWTAARGFTWLVGLFPLWPYWS